ncbi:hypothetical protein [Ravibacter arvi]|uniref:hypothetical protein n=1 Tax=Ravibacter arvi TaxID=2051041 RepID=UPI0031EA8BAF
MEIFVDRLCTRYGHLSTGYRQPVRFYTPEIRVINTVIHSVGDGSGGFDEQAAGGVN